MATVAVVASYGIVGTATQAAAEPTVIVPASADDIRVKLPVRYVSDLVVDTVHQRVYVSSGEGLTKLNFAGQILETGRTSYGDLALAPDASALYAIRGERPTLTVITTNDPSFGTEVDLGVCAVSLAQTGGKLWFAYDACDSAGDPALGWFDPVSGEVRTGLASLPESGELRADPDRPDRLVLIGWNGTVATYDASGETPVKLAERDLSDFTHCADGAVTSNGELLLTACSHTPGHQVFRTADLILHNPTTPATKVVVLAAPAFEYRQEVSIGGILTPAPAQGSTMSVTRTDRTGSHQVGTAVIGEQGLFGFSDRPTTTGPITYTVSYAGDANQPPGAGKVTTIVRPLPYDVNGDGYAETVIGAPGETLGTARSAGMFHLLYGSATGPRGVGSLGIHQDTPGVPGTAESGDRFGGVNTSGDFNGDGFADVAVSAPVESVGTAIAGGAVWIFYGSAGGLRTDNVQTVDIHDTPVTGKILARFGQSTATGDFNFDGSDDLAVGVPDSGPGYVAVFHGDDLRRLT